MGQIFTITCQQHIHSCEKGLCHPLSHHHIAADVASVLSCTSCYHPCCHCFFFAAALHCDMEPINTTLAVDHQADGISPDDDVDCLLMQDPLAVSTNPKDIVCPNLPPLEGTEQYHSHGTAVHLPSAKPRRPGRFRFKDCGVLANGDFFVDLAFQSKYPDDFLGSEIQLEGTILTVPNPQLGIFHYDIEWMTNGNLPVSFDLSDLLTADIKSNSVAFAKLKESRKLYDQTHPDMCIGPSTITDAPM